MYVSDEFMVAATLILLCKKPIEVGPVPWLLTVPSIAIIGREITMSRSTNHTSCKPVLDGS
ncbi:unnamed protein product [Eruca vesicaria subsp. sativa]|uniref:Uncharacterized protein n=1 Tax=Eruca vesicaria subsp. sativa TaxID=29727 RepID=A0ABC8L674_ERUVS|nr:unnamed protein product [Eruca vesicaria subsp. sativa]